LEKQAISAVIDELKQLHSREVLEPKIRDELTIDKRRNASRYSIFLKQENSGQIKGRGYADIRPQCRYMSKEDTSSQTVAVESLMWSCTIDAEEQRHVATADIPVAFMKKI